MNPTPTSTFRAMHQLQKVELDGATWEYWVSGKGRAGLLVLGSELLFGDCHHRLVGQFETGFKVIAPNYPAVKSVEALLDGLLSILDREGLTHVAVFGHGFGAAVAHALARWMPGRIDTLALSGFGLFNGLHALELRAQAQAMRLLPASALKRHYQQTFARLAIDAGQRGTELKQVAERLLARHTGASMLQRYLLMAELCGHPERYLFAEKIDRPAQVMLLFANDDHVYSRDEQTALARTYATPTVTRYLNGGHWVGLLPAQEFERKLKLHFTRWALPITHPRLPRVKLPPPPLPNAARAPDADTLELRQDRRLDL